MQASNLIHRLGSLIDGLDDDRVDGRTLKWVRIGK
jgi:hypothetical protein